MRTLTRTARVALVVMGAMMLNLFGWLATTASAATIVAQQAQTETNPQPSAPGIVFILLLGAIFLGVLAFSFKAYQDANR